MLQRLRQFWQQLFGPNPTNSIPLDASVLEDRVLYSATMMPMEWVDVQEGMEGHIDQIDDLVASELQNDGSIEVATFTENQDLFASLDSALLAIGADSGSQSIEPDGSAVSQVEVVFVDSSVVDYQLIVEDLRQQSFDGTRLEVAIIDSGTDGLSQISQWLSDCESRIDAIHFVTLGSDDSFKLGSTWLDAETVEQHENELRSWNNYFSEGVDLKIYGCDLASSDSGQQLISCISEWTGLKNDLIPISGPLVGDSQTNDLELDEPTAWQELEFNVGSSLSSSPSLRHEVIFIDRQLPDLQQILADLESTRSDNTTYEFVWLDQGQDGITVISNFLSQSDYDYDAVHIVSHGNAEGFQLGSIWFSNSTLVDRFGELQQWQSGLSEDVDLLIYGCSVAMTDSGQTWLSALSTQLQVDVAASTNLTGHQSLGGDWILEYSVGALESSLLPAGQTSLNWYGTLAFSTEDDTASTPNNVPITVNIATNDSGSPTVLDISNPSSGTATYSGSSITYTPTAGYTGSTSINYLATDGTEGLTNYWRLDGNGTNAIGATNGTLTNGPTTTTGRFGSALSFDEVDDYVVISDLAYNTNFSISFAFRISDNSGTLFQYLYSHGTVQTQNSVNVYLGESGSSFANTLRTIALDGNDTTTGIEIDVNLGTLGVLDGNWHTYTLTVSSTNGAAVYIDGVSRASNSTVGRDGINPTGSIYLGARNDLNVDRFLGGSLDSVAIYSQALSAADVSAREVSGSAVGTLNLMVGGAAPVNTVPTSQNISEDTTRVFSSGNGNQITIADSDAGGANNEVTISVTSGTLTLAGTTGLTFVSGDGTTDSSMTFRGTAASINTALNGLTYNSASNFNGAATLTVATEDSSLLSLNLDASMPGYYEFTSNANDTGAGAAQNGTLNGNAAIVTDATRGQVLSLDGSGDYVRITGTYSNPTEVTIGGWVNLLSATGRSEFITLSDRVHIALDDSGNGVKGSIQTGASSWVDFASGRSIAGTGWHHVMFVYSDSGNVATLYIDGVSVVSTAIASSVYWTGATDTLIGVHPSLIAYSHALMDDVRIYTRALSATDVAVLASDLSRYDTDIVIVNIAAVNDAPTAVFDTATAVEAGGVSNGTAGTNPTGNVLTNDTDVDSSDTKTVTGVAAGTLGSASGSVASSVTGTFGSINIASNGAYTYTVNNSNATVQALRTSGQTITDVFTYTMTDSGGLTSTTQITVTIQGANDTPTAVFDTATAVEAGGTANGTAGTSPTGNVLTNDTDVDSGDNMTVTGVAAGTLGSASGSVASSVAGSFGSINIAANGSYTYTVNNSNATVQALRTSGNTITDVFTYTMTDTAGATSTTQITVTIQGANDAPTVSQVTGAVAAYDFENGSGNSPSVVSGAPSMSIGSGVTYNTSAGRFSGSTGLLFSNAANSTTPPVSIASLPNVASSNAFSFGAWVRFDQTDTWGRIFDFGAGQQNSNLLLGRQAGSNNLYLESWSSGAATTGSLSIANAITNGSWMHVAVTVNSSNLVTLFVNGTSVGSYTATSALNYSGWTNNYIGASNWAADMQFRGAMDDIAIFDKALTAGEVSTLASTTTLPSVIDKNIAENSANGSNVFKARSSDVDTGDGVTYSILSGNTNSTFTINSATGQVTVNNSTMLNFEATSSYTLVIRATDTAGATIDQTVNIAVADVNETPVSVFDTATAVEAGGTSNGTVGTNPSGNVLTNDSDVDTGDTKTVTGVAAGTVGSASGSVASSVAGSFGSINIAANGAYTYTVDNSNATVQGLRTSGQTITDVFTYTMRDTAGLTSTTQITVTIQGANDSPTAVFDTATAVEAGGVSNGTAGTNPTGNVLTNDTDVDSAGNGETKTVTGILAGTQSSASGNVGSSVTGSFGSITIAASGAYTYTVDNSNATVQALRTSGQTITDVFTYTMTDTAGATSTTQITVTIQGANDAPTAVFDTATAVEAGGVSNGTAGTNPTGNVLTNDTDVDSAGNGETKTVIGILAGTQSSASGNVGSSVTGSFGSITIAASGAYTYTVDNSNATVQALRTSGQTITDVFTYTMRDTAGLTSTTQITVTIQGANDSPTAVFDTATAVEAGGVSNGTAGTNPTGNVLTNDTDVDSAGNGETKTVIGILAGTQSSASGNVGSSVTGSFGSITIAASGAYTYTVNNSNATVQALRTSGQTITDVFTYTMTDTAGATSTTQITVTIQGNNDTPYDITSGVLAVNENVADGTAVGSVTGYDVDSTETLSFSLVDSAGGRFAINSSGQITVANGSLLNFETVSSHTITVRVTDLAGAFYEENFNVTINDVNEAPVLDNSGSPLLSTITEDNINNSGQTIASIIASAGGDRITDVDAGAIEGIAVTALSSGNGTWQYSFDGTNWTDIGAVTNASALLLRSSDYIRFVPNEQNATSANFTFRAWDQTSGSAGNKVDSTSNGGATAFSSSSEVASITATAVNDAPTITNSSTVSLTGTDEDTVSTTFTVTSLLSSVAWGDVDSGAAQGIAITSTTGQGNWQYFAGGSWTSFGLTSSTTSLLLDGSTLIRYSPDGLNAETATFSFRAWDQTTGTASTNGTPQYANSTTNGGTTAFSSQASNAQIVVTAVNDAANAVADTATGSEASGYLNGTPGSNPSGNVLTNDSDVDTGDTFSVTGVAAGVVSSATGNVSSAVSGTYGSIQIAANGSYVYSIDNNNSVVQALLNSGQSLTDTFTYTIQDTGGAFSSTQIVITIVGANDAPVAAADNATAIEASGYSNGIAGTNPTGNVMSNDIDVDNGDTKTVVGVLAGVQSSASSNVGSSVTGTYGAMTINAAGAYSYVVDNSNALVQTLRTSGDTLSDVFTYTMQDAAGLTSTTQITVTIQGANDGPQANNDSALATEAGGVANGTSGTNPTGNVLTNDTDIDSGDTKTVSGVAVGAAASASGSVGVGVAGSYGTINLAADGSYTYTVDNNNSSVQALRLTSNTLSELFTYTMTDSGGLTSTATLTIMIQGSNDNPVAVANTATAIEAGGISNSIAGSDPTGNVLSNDTDVDAGDSKTVVGVAFGVQASASGSVGSSLAGTYGTIVINTDGTYTYTLDNNNATVQALNSGQSLSETFTYTMQDSTGATSTSTIQITIDGADDLPFANVDFGVSQEAGGLNNSSLGTNPAGNVFTNDILPNGSTLTGVNAGVQSSTSGSVNAAVAGLYGTITITASGDYSYTLNNSLPAVEALRTSGDHLTDIFSYTFQDTLGYYATTQVTITIDGTNDTPIAVVDSEVAIEAGGLNNSSAGSNATGNVLSNDTDVDSGDTKQVIGVLAGSVAVASGNVGASINGSYGSVVISANGSYTYVIDENNSAVQALRTSGQTLLDLFTYTIEDTAGATSTATLSITIQGTNDTPLAVSDSFIAVEAGGVVNGTAGTNPSGNVLTNDTDVDSVGNGETKTVTGVAAGTQASSSGNVASAVAGAYGSIQIASNGALTYTVDNSNAAVQALRTSGNTLTDIFTYTVTDAGGLTSTTQVTLTIQGSNDTPTVTSDTAVAIEAGGVANGTAGSNPTGNVLTNDTDVDSGDALMVSGVAAGIQASASGSIGSSVVGSYGSLNVNADGSYVYIVDNSNLSVQALRLNSDTLTDVFTYTAQDSAGATSTTQITLTIHGRNDAPIAFANHADAYESGGIANATLGSGASGNVISNDLEYDLGDTTTVSGVAAGNQISTSGAVGAIVLGSYGSITIQSDGSYTYAIDESNATVQALRLSSQTIDDIFSYTVVDAAGLSSTAQITVAIHGANDAPVAIADSGIATEAGGLNNSTTGTDATGNVLTNDTDADSGDTKSVSGVAAGVQSSTSGSVGATVAGSYGSISISSTGAYVYSIDNSNTAVQALRISGQTLQDVFSYTMVDNAGLNSTTQVTITIQGANDTPTAAADNTAIAIEAGGTTNGTAGANGTGNVLSNDTDIDSVSNGETKAVAGVAAGVQASASGNVATSVVGTFGSITINADGSYTYIVDNNNSTVQALRTTSDTLVDVFTYTMTDAGGLTSTSQVTVTLQGSNDAPIGVGDSTTAIEAGGYANGLAGANGTGNVLANDTDVDSGDSKTVSGIVAGTQSAASGNIAAAVAGLYGSITVQADGSYSYIVDNANSSVQALRTVADTLTDYFTYEVIDTAGLSSLATITITITGRNDAPIAVSDNASATEASGVANGTTGVDPTGNVLTNDTDVDSVGNGETKTVSGVAMGAVGSASGSVGTGVVGLYGAITIQSNGSYTYAVDNNSAAVQALRISGQTLDDVFSYTVTDAAGLTSTTQITVTIHGANDAPTAVADNSTAIEAGGVSNATAGNVGTGNVLTNDIDPDSAANGETRSVIGVASGLAASASGNVATGVTGSYGSVVIQADGSYTYTVDNNNAAVQALRTNGQTLTDVFTYSMEDATGASSTTQLTITIQGQNDNPVRFQRHEQSATEAGGAANSIAGVNPTGNVLTNDTDVDSIGNGETKAVLNVVSDALGGSASAAGVAVAGSYGSLTINADGTAYTYLVDNSNASVQGLRLFSDTLSESFTI